MRALREGTIVRFPDGRVAVKKVSGVWEVSGTTRERYRDEDLDDGYVVVYTPPKDVSGYGLGTILRVGDKAFTKISHSVPGGGYWQGLYDAVLWDGDLEATDFIELYVTTEGI